MIAKLDGTEHARRSLWGESRRRGAHPLRRAGTDRAADRGPGRDDHGDASRRRLALPRGGGPVQRKNSSRTAARHRHGCGVTAIPHSSTNPSSSQQTSRPCPYEKRRRRGARRGSSHRRRCARARRSRPAFHRRHDGRRDRGHSAEKFVSLIGRRDTSQQGPSGDLFAGAARAQAARSTRSSRLSSVARQNSSRATRAVDGGRAAPHRSTAGPGRAAACQQSPGDARRMAGPRAARGTRRRRRCGLLTLELTRSRARRTGGVRICAVSLDRLRCAWAPTRRRRPRRIQRRVIGFRHMIGTRRVRADNATAPRS